MLGRLDMDGDVIRARLGEGFEIGIAGLDHQVAVENLRRVRAQRRDDGRAERDVGHEMAVHHVEMNPVGAGRDDVGDLLPELGEIGGEDRGRDERSGRHAAVSLNWKTRLCRMSSASMVTS